jgi:hypothetical protein
VKEQFTVRWFDGEREPQCAPNPDYPQGIDLDPMPGRAGCVAELPYPAKRCGYYVVECNLCGYGLACTTAGRPDDPRSIKIPCAKVAEV